MTITAPRRRARGARPGAAAPPGRPPPPRARGGAPDLVLVQIRVILVDRRVVVRPGERGPRGRFSRRCASISRSPALRVPDVLDGIAGALSTRPVVRLEYDERVPVERSFEVRIGPRRRWTAALLFFRDLTAARRLEPCGSISSPMPATSCAPRWPRSSGFIETLQGRPATIRQARERFLEIMRGQAQRMTRLIDDLLSLSRIEMRAHPPEAPVDLASIVPDGRNTVAAARERGVEIQALGVGEPGHSCSATATSCLRVVENLIENAVKYGESGGRVDVALRRLGLGARAPPRSLSVRDYGPGIAPEHLPRLTERFYRVDVVESREKGGTGLGLAIVKHIVNRHRGQLEIESEPGEGARFAIALPEQAARARRRRLAVRPGPIPWRGLSCNCHPGVVDDDIRGLAVPSPASPGRAACRACMNRRRPVKTSPYAALAAGLAVATSLAPASQPTSPAPARPSRSRSMPKWAEAYNKETGNGLNYQSIGSGGGIRQIQAKTVDFGATDAPLKGEELEKDGLVQFPTVMGGVVPVINVQGRSRPAQADRRGSRRHLQRQDLQVERCQDRPAQPRRDAARRDDHPGLPVRRLGHDQHLHHLPVAGLAEGLEERSSAPAPR